MRMRIIVSADASLVQLSAETIMLFSHAQFQTGSPAVDCRTPEHLLPPETIVSKRSCNDARHAVRLPQSAPSPSNNCHGFTAIGTIRVLEMIQLEYPPYLCRFDQVRYRPIFPSAEIGV